MQMDDDIAQAQFYPNEREPLDDNNDGSRDDSSEKGEIEPGFFF